ncbi:hypothetical protein [Methanocella sp. MCL-LM]|uniref:hypothetical protein n=1 Tax=Methanocella sp. MCL-LM TaxID=3412035 RepID=UPI003C791DD0
MDYPRVNGNAKHFSQGFAFLVKIAAIIVAFWLFNVLFVASHEAGHAALATLFGAKVFDVYVSPLGFDGATTHTVLPLQYQAELVLAGGVAFTTVAVILAYLIRLDIAVYVLSLRTVESLINYSPGADMAMLFTTLGYNTLLITGVFVCTIILVVASTFHRRYAASKPVDAVARHKTSVDPTTTA